MRGRSCWQSCQLMTLCIYSLKKGLLILLQHLRTMDIDRRFCDRTSGELASENYDMWVWMTKALP